MIKFKFSIIIATYNCQEFIKDAIDSIIGQSIGFKDNVELIIVNDGSEDNTDNILMDYYNKYPKNIRILNNSNNFGPAYSRNKGLGIAQGEFVNFLDSDDYLSKNALKSVYDVLKSNLNVDIASIPIYFFGLQKGEHVLNYKFKEFCDSKNNSIVNLLDCPGFIQLSSSSSFIRLSAIKDLDLSFNENLRISEDALFVNQVLINNPNLGLVTNAKYYYRKKDPSSSLLDSSSSSKEFYISRLNDFYLDLINYSLKKYCEVPKFIQYVLAYDLQWFFDLDGKNLFNIFTSQFPTKEIIVDMKVNPSYDFYNMYTNLINILEYIDLDVIINQRNISNTLKSHILFLKLFKWDYLAQQEFYLKNLINDEFKIMLESSNFKYNKFKEEFENIQEDPLQIDIYKIKNNQIYISAVYTSIFNKDLEIFVKVNNDLLKVNNLDYPQRDNYSLNCNYGYNHYFDIKIDICKYLDFKSNGCGLGSKSNIFGFNSFKFSKNSFKSINISFVIKNSDGKLSEVEIDFNRPCKFSRISKYKLSKNYISELDNDNKSIHVYKKSWFKLTKLELNTLKSMWCEKQQGYKSAIPIRFIYFLLSKLYNSRRIWIFMDRPDHADDNGYVLFKYAINLDDNISKYFVLNKNSKDYEKVSKIGNVLSNKSLKHRIYALFAEKIISSHPDNGLVYPFWGNYPHLAGLVKSDLVFLQHGVTKDNISDWLYKADKDISLIVTVSDLENKSFLDKGYNYDKDIIKTLGFSRFDYLERLDSFNLEEDSFSFDGLGSLENREFSDSLSNLESYKINNKLVASKKKQIAIMPSWRHNLEFTFKESIKESNYFKTFNSLLNNEDLIEFLNSKDYEIIFKPHPNVYRFIDLFDKNEYVKFDYNSSYNTIFNNSSLMITDYSSVAFDFAYMKKPLIYYHYANDYHFDLNNSYFDYENMGFGEIISKEEELIELIKEYVNSDCMIKDTYEKRVDNFFKYVDNKNSKRIYQAILDLDSNY